MGHMIGRRQASRYGAGTLCGQAFKPVPLASRFMTPARSVGTGTHAPSTPRTQPPTGIARPWFGLIRFRSPLLTEYPFLQVLRCFTSLRTPGTTRFRAGPCRPAGCPIRKSSDRSHVGGSPRLIASSNVLHRYCLPRHPPYALQGGTRPEKTLMIASNARRQIITL